MALCGVRRYLAGTTDYGAPKGASVPRVRQNDEQEADCAARTDDGGDLALHGMRYRVARAAKQERTAVTIVSAMTRAKP